MTSKADPYYGALLVEQARLHLGTVMEGQDSEPFFMAMLQIAEAGVYLGYRTLRDKEVKLKGIKDFLHSCYYGLGIKDLQAFTHSVIKSSLKEKSKNNYAHKFIEWLRSQDSSFCFPEEYFEFRRVLKTIFYNKRIPKKRKILLYRFANYIYRMEPELLVQIGWNRKYKTIESCYYKEKFEEKREALKPIKTYQNPTQFQLDQLSASLLQRFGKAKSVELAYSLLLKANATTKNENSGD